MTAVATAWWEDHENDWTSGAPKRLIDILSSAYRDLAPIEAFAAGVGVRWEGGVPPAAPSEAWRSLMVRAVEGGVAIDILADVLADPDATEFVEPIERFLGDGTEHAYAAMARRHGIQALPKDRIAGVAAVARAESIVPGELQGVVDKQSMFNVEQDLQALFDVRDRTARIEVGGTAAGTGVLVGPDLLLTAAHVFDRYQFPPKPLPTDVVARFDYKLTPGRSVAETGLLVPVREFLKGSLPTPGEAASRAGDWNAPATHLDYALVRLARVPDGERGWYPIEESNYAPPGELQAFRIVQHPRGRTLEVSYIHRVEENAARTRIRYAGATEQGSSGSPIVSLEGRLIAIHHYFEKNRNQGVPVSLIFGELIAAGHISDAPPNVDAAAPAAVVEADDPFLVREFGGEAFVDRETLRDHMRLMAVQASDCPGTLVVKGNRDAGVSFSYRLAAHVAGAAELYGPLREAMPRGLKAFKVDLRRYRCPVEERVQAVAQDLLFDFDVVSAEDMISGKGDRLAQVVRNVKTVQKMIDSKLRRREKAYWVFIDSVDNAIAAQQGELGELIHALIELARDPQVCLHVMLAGRDADRVARGGAPALEDAAEGLLRGAVERWLREGVYEERGVVDEPLLEQKLAELFPPEAAPSASDVGPALPAVLQELLGSAPNGS